MFDLKCKRAAQAATTVAEMPASEACPMCIEVIRLDRPDVLFICTGGSPTPPAAGAVDVPYSDANGAVWRTNPPSPEDSPTAPPAREPSATALSIGSQLCRALGLDPSRVVRLELVVESANVAQLVVTRHFSHTQGLAVCELLTERYDLVERASTSKEIVRPANSEQKSSDS